MKQVVWLEKDILGFWVVNSFNSSVVSLVSRGGGIDNLYIVFRFPQRNNMLPSNMHLEDDGFSSLLS